MQQALATRDDYIEHSDTRVTCSRGCISPPAIMPVRSTSSMRCWPSLTSSHQPGSRSIRRGCRCMGTHGSNDWSRSLLRRRRQPLRVSAVRLPQGLRWPRCAAGSSNRGVRCGERLQATTPLDAHNCDRKGERGIEMTGAVDHETGDRGGEDTGQISDAILKCHPAARSRRTGQRLADGVQCRGARAKTPPARSRNTDEARGGADTHPRGIRRSSFGWRLSSSCRLDLACAGANPAVQSPAAGKCTSRLHQIDRAAQRRHLRERESAFLHEV